MNVIVGNLNNSKFLNLDVDIIKTINGEFSADEIVQTFSNFFFNRMFLDITAIEGYTNINNLKRISVGLDVSKIILLLSDDMVVNSDSYISNLVSMGFYNFARNESEIKYLYDNPNSYKDVAHLQKMDKIDTSGVVTSDLVEKIDDVRIIGFKNFTSHAGATSLIYMLKKILSNNYYTVAIEINKRDFMFYRDDDMVSCNANNFSNVIYKYNNANIVLVDLNDLDMTTANSVCDDIIYLMGNNKVVLNQSLLDNKDVSRLQFESGIRFFSVIPCLDDRKDNSEELYPLLERLELYKKK